MAHTQVGSSQVQKLGRYSKEFIKVTFSSTSNTPATLDTKLNIPLYGKIHVPIDLTATNVQAAVIISTSPPNQVTLSNRAGALLNGQTVIVELTGY